MGHHIKEYICDHFGTGEVKGKPFRGNVRGMTRHGTLIFFYLRYSSERETDKLGIGAPEVIYDSQAQKRVFERNSGVMSQLVTLKYDA